MIASASRRIILRLRPFSLTLLTLLFLTLLLTSQNQSQVAQAYNSSLTDGLTAEDSSGSYSGSAYVFFRSIVTVDTTIDFIDANGGSCAGLALATLPGPDGLTSLREAICATNTNAGPDTILFNSSLNGSPITLSIASTPAEEANVNGDLDITDNTTIIGNGARQTIIQGGVSTAAGISRVLDVQASGTLLLQNVTIRHGLSMAPCFSDCTGGGIRNNQGTLTVQNSTITANQAIFGGGIYTINPSTTTIEGSTISNNDGFGGGVENNGTFNLRNSTVSGNSSGSARGGLRNNFGTMTIDNSTISDNHANGGAGGGIDGNVSMKNSLLADNTATTTGPDCNGTLTSQDYNLIENTTGCTIVGTTTNNITGIDPALAALSDNGGPTDTQALGGASPALDGGDPTNCRRIDTTAVTEDQRGVPRPQNGICDIGAYEYVSVAAASASGGNGPGGVGHNDGATPLALWLDGGENVYSNLACSTESADTDNATCWQDKSGNNLTFSQTIGGEEPLFRSSILNGQPVIRFDGINDNLQHFNFAALNGQDNYSIFLIGSSSGAGQDYVSGINNSTDHGLILETVASNNLRFLHRMPFSTAGGNSLITTGGNAPFNTANLMSFVRDFSSGSQYLLVDGGNLESIASTNLAFNQNINLILGQLTTVGFRQLNGDIAEMIIFSNALPDVERILVENYLHANYGIALDTVNGALDVYDGDEPGNDDFDLDVAGIGQLGGNQHVQSHSAGIIVRDVDFLNDNGDWLTFGHHTLVAGETAADLPSSGDWATAPNPKRWTRHWYFDRTDVVGTNGGTVDIIFDQSEGGMDAFPSNVPATPTANYRLLGRSGDSGDFMDITASSGAVVVINGDQIMFLGVDVSVLGSNFTVGTLDEGNSPTALTLLDIGTNGGLPIGLPLVMALMVISGLTLFVLGRRRQ